MAIIFTCSRAVSPLPRQHRNFWTDNQPGENWASLCEVIEVVVKITDLRVFPLQQHLHVQVGQPSAVSLELAGGQPHPAATILHPQLHTCPPHQHATFIRRSGRCRTATADCAGEGCPTHLQKVCSFVIGKAWQVAIVDLHKHKHISCRSMRWATWLSWRR